MFENFEHGLSEHWVESATGRWDTSGTGAIAGQVSLHHVFDNDEAGHDQIALEHSLLMLDSLKTTWSFRIRHAQNPSASNNWAVFPVSDGTVDQLTPGKVYNAYAVGVNFAGSDDMLKLWKVNNGTRSTLINTGFNWEDNVGTEKAPYLEIRRSPAGLWEIFLNTEGDSTQLSKLGEAMDGGFNVSASFGIYYAYTKTYDQALWFDNLSITGHFITDTVPPRVEKAYFLTDTLVKVRFDEVCKPGGFIPDHVSTQPPGVVKEVELVSNRELLLTLEEGMTFTNPLQISLTAIEDVAGNTMNDTTLQLNFHRAGFSDMIISEVMYDPVPPVGLPDAEYIELLNTSAHSFNLYGWQLTVGNNNWQIPDQEILPGEYLIICKTDMEPLFEDYGCVLPLFTSVYSLKNDGDTIVLSNEKGDVINAFAYRDAFHTNIEKQGGGWSLEIIDPDNQCNPEQNWSSSTDPAGGTPGRVNSINDFNLDTIAPFISGYHISDSLHLQFVFSEPIDRDDLNITDVAIDQGIGYPESMYWTNDTTVHVTLEHPVQQGVNYVVSLTGITDLCGNTKDEETHHIQYYVAGRFDIIITEVMFDPVPAYGLPEEEYIEIYNAAAAPIRLKNWQLLVNDSRVVLPDAIILPHEYALLTDRDTRVFADSITTLVLARLPALPNNGGTVVLLDSLGTIIHAMQYDAGWIDSEFKKDGGWSLEMVDIENPCAGASNWKESTYFAGGTPGFRNSVRAPNPDLQAPYATRLGYLNDSVLRIHFNEALDSTSINRHFFRVDDGLLPVAMDFEFPLHRAVDLHFPTTFQAGHVYHLTVQDGFRDCAGNMSHAGRTFTFGKPVKAEPNDIVINEMMFNPLPGGAHYIELFNRSQKIIDLASLYLVGLEPDNTLAGQPHVLSNDSYLFYPGKYLAITTDTNYLAENYVPCPASLIQLERLPSMPNVAGGIALIDHQQVRIDSVFYNSSWHSGWVKNAKGVALERLNPEWSGAYEDNWTSGIATTGYGTPGCENANFTLQTKSEAEFTVEPQLFTPNADGYHDEVVFNYSLQEGNYMLHVWVYNSNGRLVAQLKQDELVGHEGFFSWDGRNSSNLLCPIGIYMVYAQFVGESGRIEEFKRTCVLGKKVE